MSAAARRRSGDRAGRLAFGMVVALLVAACPARTGPSESGSARRAATAPAAGLDVVLVLVDTLRADHLSLYGYGRPTSPRLQELAGEGVVFESARSQAGCTFPSVNSLLTSRSPQLFLERARRSVRRPDGGSVAPATWAMGLPPEVESLPQALAAAGYRTFAASASPIVRATPSKHNPEGGFGGGFDRFDEDCLWHSAECVIGKALRELDAADPAPRFLYLHLMDPHAPYRPPERRFAGAYRGGLDFVGRGDPKPIDDRIHQGDGQPGIGVEDLRHLVALYDDEIAHADAWIGRLVDALRERGRWSRTVLMVAADHGEEFLEHGSIRHCHTVWDTEIRVPLLLRWPGATPGRRLDAAANLDIAPTLLALLGLPALPAAEGRDLLAPPDPGAPEPVVFAAQAQYLAAVSGDRKLVQDLRRGEARLFDWRADPLERHDRLAMDAEAARGRALQKALRDWVRASASGSAQGGLEAAEEAERTLRALGYL